MTETRTEKAQRLVDEGRAVTEDKWCFNCGYPVKMRRVRDKGGEHLTFYDGKTGDTIEDCPQCHSWPLAVYGIQSKESADALRQRLEPWYGNDRPWEWAL